jgi:hypothetical protein
MLVMRSVKRTKSRTNFRPKFPISGLYYLRNYLTNFRVRCSLDEYAESDAHALLCLTVHAAMKFRDARIAVSSVSPNQRSDMIKSMVSHGWFVCFEFFDITLMLSRNEIYLFRFSLSELITAV